MKRNNSCPNDRKLITESSLMEPPRILINLINNLKIRCDFFKDGCHEILKLDCLSAHVKKCLLNPHRECLVCGLKLNGENDHNCVQSLKAINSVLETQLNELTTKIKILEQNKTSIPSNNLVS